MSHPWQKIMLTNILGAHSWISSPFLRKNFRSQRRTDVNARREVPAAESPAAKGMLDSGGASQVGSIPDQCPVAPHVRTAEPLSVQPSGHANSHTVPDMGSPLQLMLTFPGAARLEHCTTWQEGTWCVHRPWDVHSSWADPCKSKPSSQWKVQEDL